MFYLITATGAAITGAAIGRGATTTGLILRLAAVEQITLAVDLQAENATLLDSISVNKINKVFVIFSPI
jgi:hypothetical protein